MISIQDAVNQIKEMIENAIIEGGVTKKNNLIRSQTPICLLHDAVKTSFIKAGVNPSYIHPAYGEHKGELKLAGFFKCKDQDICIVPNDKKENKETLNFEGILKGQLDPYGRDFTERILSVNVRSQLSSINKNFDTLYERTFAEAVNLHLRCPKMVLGEIYMIPVFPYNDNLAKSKEVGFKANKNISKHIEKYISSFNAINARNTVSGKDYKYEKVCLLIVDFSKDEPKIYNTDAELKRDKLLPQNSTSSIKNLNFNRFVKDLLKIYEQRFGVGKFI